MTTNQNEKKIVDISFEGNEVYPWGRNHVFVELIGVKEYLYEEPRDESPVVIRSPLENWELGSKEYSSEPISRVIDKIKALDDSVGFSVFCTKDGTLQAIDFSFESNIVEDEYGRVTEDGHLEVYLEDSLGLSFEEKVSNIKSFFKDNEAQIKDGILDMFMNYDERESLLENQENQDIQEVKSKECKKKKKTAIRP